MKVKHFFEFLLFKLVQILLYPFPRYIYIKAGEFIGSIAFGLFKSKRKIAIENLKLAFGNEMSEGEIKDMAKKCFHHFGFLIFDTLWFMKKRESHLKTITHIKGIDILKKTIGLGKGVIILSAHFGNWEIIPHVLVSEGIQINAIARKFDNPYLDKVIKKFRERSGNRIIYKQDAKKEAVETLKKGGCLAILADQNTLKDRGVFVDFFGIPACTSTGPAIFHLKYDSPIIPIFCYTDRNYNYIIEIKEPLPTKPEDDVLKITQRYTKIIEDEIRKRPHLWLWLHQRWREKP